MDADFNHVEIDESWHRGFGYHWLWKYPESTPFTGEYAESGFGTPIDFHNRCSEQFIVDACQYWIDTFGIDGLRLVLAKGYYDGSVEHGLPKVSRAVGLRIGARPMTTGTGSTPIRRRSSITAGHTADGGTTGTSSP